MDIKINEVTITPAPDVIPVITNPADRIPENWDIVPSDKNEMWFVYHNKATGSHFEGPKREFMSIYMKG